MFDELMGTYCLCLDWMLVRKLAFNVRLSKMVTWALTLGTTVYSFERILSHAVKAFEG